MKQDNTKYYLIGGVALLAYFGFLRPILKKFGFATAGETNKVNAAETAPDQSNPFKPGYYKEVLKRRAGQPVTLKSASGLSKIYKVFYDGFGYIYDDEAKITSAFIQLASKAQVSQFAEYVQKQTGRDIITFMKTGINSVNAGAGLNDTEISRIIDIVNSKPEFTK